MTVLFLDDEQCVDSDGPYYCSKELKKLYEEYVLTEGDFDERVFLCDDVDRELGTPIKSPPPQQQCHSASRHRREVAQHLAEVGGAPAVLLSRQRLCSPVHAFPGSSFVLGNCLVELCDCLPCAGSASVPLRYTTAEFHFN